MSRVFPYEEWAPNHDSDVSTSSFSTPYDHDSRGSVALPFRKRLQSLPLIGNDVELFRSSNASRAGNNLAQDDEKKPGRILGLIRKASVSIKNRQRRHSHAIPIEERPQTASPWHRLKTVASFHRHSRVLPANYDTDGLFESHDEDVGIVPIPGHGKEPPRIPRNHGGAAARASAIAARQFEIDLIERNRQRLSPPGSLGDRESGIGISVTQFDQVVGNGYPVTSSVDSRDRISLLPDELKTHILGHLDVRTLCNVFLVSRVWAGIRGDKSIWREVFLREQTKSYATGRPIPLGAGLGLPPITGSTDCLDLFRIRLQLQKNWRLGRNDAYYLHGHLDSVYCVQFDEEKIITGSRDKTIRVWDLKTRSCSLIIGPPAVVENPSIQFDETGRPLHYTTCSDSNDSERREQGIVKTVSFQMYHEQSILCLQYDERILVTGSSDGTCIVYDMADGYRPIRRLRHHTAAVLDLAFDDRYIVTCSKDTTICVWDRDTGAMLKKLAGHTGPVNAVQLRGDTIVSCSGDFRVIMWNITSGLVIQQLIGHTKGLACSQFSEDSKWIASAGNDRAISIWDANNYRRIHNIPDAHESLVRSLHIDSISGRMVSGSYDSGLKVFDMATGSETINFPRWHGSWVLGAKSDYRHIISTGQEPKILIMDFGSGIGGIDKLRSRP